MVRWIPGGTSSHLAGLNMDSLRLLLVISVLPGMRFLLHPPAMVSFNRGGPAAPGGRAGPRFIGSVDGLTLPACTSRHAKE